MSWHDGVVARRAPARWSWPWTAAVAALTAAAIVLSTGWGGERFTTTVTDVAAVVAALAGALLVFRAARRAEAKLPWQLLGTALVMWGLGEVLWGYDEVIRGKEVPFPSIADIAYLGAVPFAIAGLLAFARAGGARFHVRSILDGCLVSGSLLFITWALVLGPLWRADAGSAWTQVVTVAYPVTDLVLAVLALVVVQWGRTDQRAALRMIAAGLLVMAATDTAFTWLINNDTYSSSNPISLLWPLSYLMIGYAATLRAESTSATLEPAEASIASMLTPYIPLLGAIAVAVPRVLGGGSLGPFLTINGAALVGLVLARQALTAWDLRSTVVELNVRELELQRLALDDPLTGVANRASFGARLETVVNRPGREPAVVYIDLDGFKEVNDRFGHAVGDQLLIDVSRRLQACLEGAMLLARLGGDEFVVLVEDGHAAAVRVARQILDVFRMPFDHDGESIPFQASLGIAVAPAGGSPDEAVRRADAAMYVAKTTGKGRAVDYPDSDLLAG